MYNHIYIDFNSNSCFNHSYLYNPIDHNLNIYIKLLIQNSSLPDLNHHIYNHLHLFVLHMQQHITALFDT